MSCDSRRTYDAEARAIALASLVPRLTGSEREAVVAEVLTLAAKPGHHYSRKEAISGAAAAMSPAQRVQALQILDTLIEEPDAREDVRTASARVAGYTEMIPLLDAPQRDRVRDEALRSAYSLPVVGAYEMVLQPKALKDLLPHLEQSARAGAIQTILSTLPSLRQDWERSSILRGIAAYLDADQRADARAIAETITSSRDRQSALDALVESA